MVDLVYKVPTSNLDNNPKYTHIYNTLPHVGDHLTAEEGT
jgi:hypothetical protein